MPLAESPVESLAAYLKPGRFIDSDAPNVVAFARNAAGDGDDITRIRRLYLAARDDIVYDPYVDFGDPENYRASSVLERKRTFCIGKAALLAAAARAIGIPARVGYADVRNHLTSPKLRERIKTDIFMWHSYTELYLDGAWVKATPAFDAALCARAKIAPLEFDGRTDSLFQPLDASGRRHMEYLKDHGSFADVPYEIIENVMRTHYPALVAQGAISGDFRTEAVAPESAG